MPTITFSIRDLQHLTGKKLGRQQIEELLALYAKAEVESFDEHGDEISVSLDDTNLPYLWSVEGIARLLKGVLGVEKGLPLLNVNKSDYRIIVDSSVKSVRPYIAAFVARNRSIDHYLLKQLVQLQEKFCESYGRRRQKVSIGLYSYKRITFPVRYTTSLPQQAAFVPLESRSALSLAEILEKHPKGREYGWILKGAKRYPLLLDDKKEVLSFPPIINSHFTGRVEENDTELFFEITGTDAEAVNLGTNIFARALHERGFQIHSCTVVDGSRKTTYPRPFHATAAIPYALANDMLGLSLAKKQIHELLLRARYGIAGSKVIIPDYRRDILHPVDIVEDIAILYGYDRITPLPITSYTPGKGLPMSSFLNRMRDLAIGMGFQELFSPILSNKVTLYEKMQTPDSGTVEIAEYMSETYSVVRSWLLPILMEVLSKNRHREYPQRLFEQGLVTKRTKNIIADEERIAFVTAHSAAGFTEAKQALDSLLKSLGLSYSLEQKTKEACFIPGRNASIMVKGSHAGIIGELSPEALTSFGLEVPVAGFELDLSLLFKLI